MATVLSSISTLLTDQECLNQIRRMLANSIGAGAANDDTQRVTLASDDPAVSELQKLNGSGSKSTYVSTVAGLATSLAASGSDESDAISLDTVGETQLIVQITCTFNASATAGMTVKCLTSLDGTTYDDPDNPTASSTIPVSAGSTETKTFYFQVYPPCAKIRIENDDAAQSITGISAKQYIPPVS